MKTILITSFITLVSMQVVAQAEPASQRVIQDPMLPFYLTGGAVFLLFILVAVVGIYVIRVLNMLTKEALQQNKSVSAVTGKLHTSPWERFFERMNASVPLEKEKEIELHHSYDGIRELDNHLPPWWKWLFYGSIVWGVVYMIVFHLTESLPLSQEEYRTELSIAEEAVRKHQAAQPQATIDETSLTYSDDASTLDNGKSVFMNNNCGGCHRNDGGGNTIGPNLTDEYWLHGGEIKNIFQTIKNGVVEKGMPAWGKSMSAQDVRDVTFFVISLQGSNPPEAKAPQGDIFRQEKTTSDSLKIQAGL